MPFSPATRSTARRHPAAAAPDVAPVRRVPRCVACWGCSHSRWLLSGSGAGHRGTNPQTLRHTGTARTSPETDEVRSQLAFDDGEHLSGAGRSRTPRRWGALSRQQRSSAPAVHAVSAATCSGWRHLGRLDGHLVVADVLLPDLSADSLWSWSWWPPSAACSAWSSVRSWWRRPPGSAGRGRPAGTPRAGRGHLPRHARGPRDQHHVHGRRAGELDHRRRRHPGRLRRLGRHRRRAHQRARPALADPCGRAGRGGRRGVRPARRRPFPVLRWAVQSGGVPTIRRWLSSGDYQLSEWTPQLPCTTPASQLGILHGTVLGSRRSGGSTGSSGGCWSPTGRRTPRSWRTGPATGAACSPRTACRSPIFSGDASRSMLTMSRLGAARRSPETRRAMAWFLATPSGFARSPTRTVAEVVKERWQARQQDLQRSSRGGRLDLRAPPCGQQRPPPRPQHRPGGRRDAARHQGRLRRLRGLRRDRPPRRHVPARVAGRPRRARPRARAARADRRAGGPPLPHRRPLRPRPVPGPAVRGPTTGRTCPRSVPVSRRRRSAPTRRRSRGGAAPGLSSRTWAPGGRGARGRPRRARMRRRLGSGHAQPTHEEDVVVLGSGQPRAPLRARPGPADPGRPGAALAAAAARA